VQLAPLVEDALELVRAMLPAPTRLEIALNPDAGLVHGDSTQLNQVVVNVVLNAHQALPPEGGRITIALEPIVITSADLPDARPSLSAGPYARLVVQDDGHGMEPTVLARIFEPFFTTKPPGSGTGLGLSVVHGIVKSHRGALRVTSAQGAGTRFEIYLPRIAQADRPVLEVPHAPRGRGERVLVVDDQAPVGHALGRLLERLEYVATVETEPEAALARLETEPGAFDLVLTDLTMPTLSGIELATRMRAAGIEVPVVLVSGSWSSHDAIDLGLFAAVLPKPCDAATLGTTLRLVLD
jgi:CheY-like chemotaxis protein